MLAYDSALLVEIGSSLGLWLGLSIIGVYDLLVFALLKIPLLIKIKFLGTKKKNDKDKITDNRLLSVKSKNALFMRRSTFNRKLSS